jgi:uncharacterized membrane protein YeiH
MPHYAVGWAHGLCTPYQWTNQVASHYGGTRNGTIVHWPSKIDGRGEVRSHGGVSRDLILGKVPAALLNPWYLFFSLDAALLASVLHYRSGHRLRKNLFQFATSLALPWYAIVGANAALQAKLPYVSAVLIGIIGSTTGRFIVDLSCGVTPKLFVRGEWFVGTAALASVAYIVCDAGLKLSIWPASLISFTIAFLFRCSALLRHWEEPEPEPWAPRHPGADEPAQRGL